MRGAAALSLWPPNADRHVALRALIDAAPHLSNDSGPAIDAVAWQRWLGSRSSKKLRMFRRDGIHDEPLVSQGVLRGRGHDLLAGSLESPALQYRLLVDALTLCGADDDDTLRDALCLLEVVARLSTRIVWNAKLAGYRWPEHSLKRSIGVPDQEVYERLCSALTFTSETVDPDPVRAACLTALVARDDEYGWKPLRRNEATGEWLVADPWRLTQSALVRAYVLIARSERREEIHVHVRAGAVAVAVEAARDMDWRVEHVADSSVLASIDFDCRIAITVAVLPPETWDLGKPEVEAPPGILNLIAETTARARAQDAQINLVAVLFDGRCLTVPAKSVPDDQSDPLAPWIVSVTDLRLMGDALRRDPLALTAALEEVPPRPWPEGIDLADIVGIVHRAEATPPDQRHIPRDGTEHLHLKARAMAARHPVPGPDGDRWVEAYRWRGSADDRCFTTSESDRFALVARVPGRSVWIACTDPNSGPHDLDGFICRLLAFWVGRMAEQGFPELPVPVELSSRIDVELSEVPGPALIVRYDRAHPTLVAGPAFIHALCRGDNVADRMLIAAVLDAVDDREVERREEFVDLIAPLGTGTAGIWPYPSLRSNPPVLHPPPLVARRDRLAVGRELASTRVPREQVVVLQGENSAPAVRDLAAGVEALLSGRVAKLQPEGMLDLIELNEAAAIQTTLESIGLPARAAMNNADAYLGERESTGERNVALRALIERIAALPPDGDHLVGLREAGWLRAAAELQVRLGGAFEFLRTGKATAKVLVGDEVGVEVFLHGELPDATDLALDQIEEAAPDAMLAEYDRWWTADPQAPVQLPVHEPIELADVAWQAVDDAFLTEWSVRFEELLRLFNSLSQLAEREPHNVAVLRCDVLLDRLVKMTGIHRAHVAAAIGLATLGPCDYNVFDAEHRPWRSNRCRSYLRQPLVDVGDGRLAWSSTHMLTAAHYLHSLIQGGRLRSSGTLAIAVMKLSQKLDREFEIAVLDRARDAGWEALLRRSRLGGVWLERVSGQQIGDIDVLTWHSDREQVWLLDAKRLAPGFAADSMLDGTRKLQEAAERQRERLSWVLEHRRELSAEIGHNCSDWRVRPAIVIDSPLVGAHIGDVGMPVWTYWELRRRLERSPRDVKT
jgi:hypothetical protein